jgi:hypothetical protein
MKQYLSATEFAKIVKRDPKTVISWVKQDLIPGSKRVGNVYQIPTKEIDIYQSESRYPPKKWQK